ncbi:MAG: hypothetical protein K9K67_14285 [Bacteriovoracaceae bacterium]|nr:hypothetical protein [Bacteriovoracaceae bacterium]
MKLIQKLILESLYSGLPVSGNSESLKSFFTSLEEEAEMLFGEHLLNTYSHMFEIRMYKNGCIIFPKRRNEYAYISFSYASIFYFKRVKKAFLPSTLVIQFKEENDLIIDGSEVVTNSPLEHPIVKIPYSKDQNSSMDLALEMFRTKLDGREAA